MVSGCAVHYYDGNTQTEHLWGLGHMKMKYLEPNEGLQAVVHGTDVAGVSLGKADKHGYFTVGWHRIEFIDVVKESIAIRIEWPTNDFVNVRIGSRFPNTTFSPLETQSRHVDISEKPTTELNRCIEYTR
jgi:hypothetical protein